MKQRKTINMKTTPKLASSVLVGTLLSARMHDTGSATPTLANANQGCLAAVAQTTGNSEVWVL